MGDLFFIIKMAIYTFIIVIIMQIKVGTTTLESRVIELTHRSEVGQSLQKVAESAAAVIGIQYRKVASHFKGRYFERNSSSQIPGQRLREKFKSWQEKTQETLEQEE